MHGDVLIAYGKESLLRALYRSTERMNVHIINNNSAGVIAEQALQRNLRADFEALQSREH